MLSVVQKMDSTELARAIENFLREQNDPTRPINPSWLMGAILSRVRHHEFWGSSINSRESLLVASMAACLYRMSKIEEVDIKVRYELLREVFAITDRILPHLKRHGHMEPYYQLQLFRFDMIFRDGTPHQAKAYLEQLARQVLSDEGKPWHFWAGDRIRSRRKRLAAAGQLRLTAHR